MKSAAPFSVPLAYQRLFAPGYFFCRLWSSTMKSGALHCSRTTSSTYHQPSYSASTTATDQSAELFAVYARSTPIATR